MTAIERGAEFHLYSHYGSNSRIDWNEDITEQEREQHRLRARAVFESIDEDELAAALRPLIPLSLGAWLVDATAKAQATAIKAHLLSEDVKS